MSSLKIRAASADLGYMVATSFRNSHGLLGTIVSVVFLLASRIQLEKSQPPGAVGASLDVAMQQVTTALFGFLLVVVVGLVLQRRR